MCCFSNKELCYIFLSLLFFSFYKACSFWNSDILHPIVERALFVFPQNINIHGANTAVKLVCLFLFFLSERGTPGCSWPSSKLAFERFILQYARLNTGFLRHFPNICLGCVCHNSRRSKYFLISCKEELVLKIYRTDDAKSLVQRLCEIVTNKLSSDTTVYCIQFIAYTCQIREGTKRKILRCYKSSRQK